MSPVIFEHIKGAENILADHFLCLRSIHFYDSLDSEGEEKELGHGIFEELLPFM